VRLAVLADVREPEAHRQVEVELDRGQLPLAAERVVESQVDLRAVEGAAALVDLVRDPGRLDRAAERRLGPLPLGDLADELLRPGRDEDRC
jgi:hypothetical protein